MLLLIYNVQTFHESNFFTKEVTKELISGNIFCGMVSHTKKVKVKSNKIQKMCYLVHQFSTCTSVLTVLPTFAILAKQCYKSKHSFQITKINILILTSKILFKMEYTVWKFQNFSFTHILCEIKSFKKCKICHFTTFRGS